MNNLLINNPLNIKNVPGQVWVGTDPRNSGPFVWFLKPEDCYRAGTKIIMRHYVEGDTKIPDVIGHWAPPAENNTDAYAAAVDKFMAQGGRPLNLPAELSTMLHAMTIQEQGHCPYDDSVILNGIAMAGDLTVDHHVDTLLAPAVAATAPKAPDGSPASAPWYTSKVQIGMLVTAAILVLQKAGVKIPESLQSETTNFIYDLSPFLPLGFAIVKRWVSELQPLTIRRH
jgi:hypothetical protein